MSVIGTEMLAWPSAATAISMGDRGCMRSCFFGTARVDESVHPAVVLEVVYLTIPVGCLCILVNRLSGSYRQ